MLTAEAAEELTAVEAARVKALAKSAAAWFATMQGFAPAPAAHCAVTGYLGQAGAVDLSRAASATRIRSG